MSAVVASCRNTHSGPILDALTRALLARDPMTFAHSERVQRHAVALARAVHITDYRLLDAIETAALLHDIGKLGIPDRLLDKPGPLTPDEYEQVKEHTTIGADIIAAVPLPRSIASIVRNHHEQWDGNGYPDGLRGEAIPMGARVLAVVDCYDALTSNRPYRQALSHDAAVALMRQGRGSMYDPRVADAFLAMIQRERVAANRARMARPVRRSQITTWRQESSAS